MPYYNNYYGKSYYYNSYNRPYYNNYYYNSYNRSYNNYRNYRQPYYRYYNDYDRSSFYPSVNHSVFHIINSDPVKPAEKSGQTDESLLNQQFEALFGFITDVCLPYNLNIQNEDENSSDLQFERLFNSVTAAPLPSNQVEEISEKEVTEAAPKVETAKEAISSDELKKAVEKDTGTADKSTQTDQPAEKVQISADALMLEMNGRLSRLEAEIENINKRFDRIEQLLQPKPHKQQPFHLDFGELLQQPQPKFNFEFNKQQQKLSQNNPFGSIKL